jgi:hypothetical protein
MGLVSATVQRAGTAPAQRLLRLALVVYLSPVILLVLAIGVVGVVAASLGRPPARVAVDGVHPAHGTPGPSGIVGEPTHVRETV